MAAASSPSSRSPASPGSFSPLFFRVSLISFDPFELNFRVSAEEGASEVGCLGVIRFLPLLDERIGRGDGHFRHSPPWSLSNPSPCSFHC